ncbi:MAG: class I SAM-dependent methyltransferase [Chitinophagaceae bacterium]|nr:class I SAM-dependent methyltransferase [Chitinophagaceae bacterium]
MDQSFWDSRYAHEEYAYGTAPNAFLATQLAPFPKGKLLFPCDGEGRNGVYAATLGHDVYAFDLSSEGQRKALQLAEQHGVSMHYQVGDFNAMQYPDEQFDGIALIYAHFPPNLRFGFHQQVMRWLKPGGTLWIEGFSEAHTAFQAINPQAGGPKDPSFLYTTEGLMHDFQALNIQQLNACETTLHEGPFHVGQAAVVRLVAVKPL